METYDGHKVRLYNGKWCICRDGKICYLSRLIYEKEHGVTLLVKQRIYYKDGDPKNLSLDNLTLKRPSKFQPIEIDPLNGAITKNGKNTGCYDHKGYHLVFFQGKQVFAHRLIFEIYHKTKIPEGMVINHINFDTSDNRIENLELVTQQQNMQYQQLSRKNNTTGFKGICFLKQAQKYTAGICHNGKNIHLGRFENARDAALAYNQKCTTLNENENCHYTLNPL